MVKFFVPEDFKGDLTATEKTSLDNICRSANAKLEREGKVVYGHSPLDSTFTVDQTNYDSYKALLIGIEEIKRCEHPSEKVKLFSDSDDIFAAFHCECGARVQPKEFEVVK
jgi:hypothetical protein